MTTMITELDEAAVATGNGYRYDLIVAIAGRIVRAHVERKRYLSDSVAVVDMINDEKSWTRVVEDLACEWWNTTPPPGTHINAAGVLYPVADQLLHRAATVLAPPPIAAPTLSPHVLDAVSALLATTYGYDGERRITPDDMTWANTHGGRLHIIKHDGSVTFTKAHRDQCPFITGSGTQNCDDECDFEHPADAQRRLGQ